MMLLGILVVVALVAIVTLLDIRAEKRSEQLELPIEKKNRRWRVP